MLLFLSGVMPFVDWFLVTAKPGASGYRGKLVDGFRRQTTAQADIRL
jgi:hypothetical protein